MTDLRTRAAQLTVPSWLCLVAGSEWTVGGGGGLHDTDSPLDGRTLVLSDQRKVALLGLLMPVSVMTIMPYC